MSHPPQSRGNEDLYDDSAISIIASAESSQQVYSKEELIALIVADWDEKEAKVLKAWVECPYLPDELIPSLSKLVETSVDHAATVEFLQKTVLGALKSTGGKTADTTPAAVLASRSLDSLSAQSSPQTHPRYHNLELLRRDRGRCQLSGRYSRTIKTMQVEKPNYVDELGLRDIEFTKKNAVKTEGAHIFSHKLGEYTLKSTKAARAKEKCVQQFWQAIYFMFPSLVGRIGCNNIDSLSNGITMASSLHDEFGGFAFGLQYLDENLYQVINFELSDVLEAYFEEDDEGRLLARFTYRSGCPDEDKIDRHLLAIHLALSHVLHVTGAGALAEWEEDEEEEESEPVFEEIHGPDYFDQRFAEQLSARLLYV